MNNIGNAGMSGFSNSIVTNGDEDYTSSNNTLLDMSSNGLMGN